MPKKKKNSKTSSKCPAHGKPAKSKKKLVDISETAKVGDILIHYRDENLYYVVTEEILEFLKAGETPELYPERFKPLERKQ